LCHREAKKTLHTAIKSSSQAQILHLPSVIELVKMLLLLLCKTISQSDHVTWFLS